MTDKPVTEQRVLEIVTQAFETILKKHEGVGRHELNRSETAAALADLKTLGLPAMKAGAGDLM